ncbi:MAG: FixH family protein [Chitinophagales bacterium]|nr:FixH family protein [Chitinophagales bacterium]
MNFGYKILITLVLFVTMMLGMLYISMQQTNETLDDNYYVREQEYQKLIDAEIALQKIRTQALVDQSQSQVIVQLPKNSFQHIQNGQIEFLKPDNQSLDVQFKLEPDENGAYYIDKQNLVKGVYKIRVKWENDGQMYYDDNNFQVL